MAQINEFWGCKLAKLHLRKRFVDLVTPAICSARYRLGTHIAQRLSTAAAVILQGFAQQKLSVGSSDRTWSCNAEPACRD